MDEKGGREMQVADDRTKDMGSEGERAHFMFDTRVLSLGIFSDQYLEFISPVIAYSKSFSPFSARNAALWNSDQATHRINIIISRLVTLY